MKLNNWFLWMVIPLVLATASCEDTEETKASCKDTAEQEWALVSREEAWAKLHAQTLENIELELCPPSFRVQTKIETAGFPVCEEDVPPERPEMPSRVCTEEFLAEIDAQRESINSYAMCLGLPSREISRYSQFVSYPFSPDCNHDLLIEFARHPLVTHVTLRTDETFPPPL